MNDKHDPNGAVPIGTFAATDEGEFEIPIEVVNDDEVEPRTLAIQTGSDDGGRFSDEQTPVEAPRRKRVQTLLGVAMPGAALNGLSSLPAVHDPTRATSGEISRAVDDVLDDQQTTVYGHKRESGGLRALDSMLAGRSAQESSPRSARVDGPSDPGEIVGVVGDPSDTGTYQIELFDIDIDEASRDGDVPRVANAAVAPAVVESRARDRANSPASVEPQPAPSAAPVPASEPRVEVRPAARVDTKPVAKPEPVHAATAPRPAKSDPASKKPVSSLAPAEIARPAAARKDSSPVAGAALLAAMVLLGIGGYWLTAGGYQRATDPGSQPAAAARPPKPAPDSLAAPKAETVAPAAAPAEAPAEAVAAADEEADAPSPSFAPNTTGRRPRVATKTVRKPAPAPVAETTGQAETPSRSDVLAGLDQIRSSVQACAEGRNGVAEVDLTIAANGSVTNALVGGDFGGTPQGSCIARAVRKARFPQFKQDRYRVLFPYVL